MIKIRFYLSHSIRGKYGKSVTPAQMKANCDKAILIANLIRNAILSIEIYCPAEHEAFVGTAWHKHYLDEKQILDVDCTIIDGCEGVIIYVPEGDKLQGGRKVEYDYVINRPPKPVWIFDNVEWIINRLAEYLLKV